MHVNVYIVNLHITYCIYKLTYRGVLLIYCYLDCMQDLLKEVEKFTEYKRQCH